MRGFQRGAATAFGCGALLTATGLARPLESLNRKHWVPLDSAETDQATDVATGSGGSMVYVSGYKQSAPGADGTPNTEALLMAYNSSGAQQWVAKYGSSGDDFGNSVAADSAGVYLAGTTFVPSNGTAASDDRDNTDAFVVKYNSTGGLVWKKSWGTSQPDLGNGVAVDGDSGRVYVVGTTRGSMGADVRTIGSESSGAMGEEVGGVGAVGGGAGVGNADEGGGSIEVKGDDVSLNAGQSDVFLTCLDAANGEIRWTVQFGSSTVDVGNGVAVGPRGGVFLVGQLGDDNDPSLWGSRAFLAKYDYLGNAQFTARLNSSSSHFAVDLAPSLGSGGEGVVYMSGYTLGDNASMFLARFEGSTGTQAWLSHMGEKSDMPHLALSVEVIEGSQGDSSATESGGGGGVSTSNGGTGAEAPVVEGVESAIEPGNDARIVVVGYNTSAPSADSHSSTGFTAAADTNGEWAWHSVSQKASRETAIAVGGAHGDSSAFIVGTVAATEASPGNYLFLDIREVVRKSSPTPPPTDASTPGPTATVDPIGGQSATTGLSQGSSLWLLIIAPIFVVLSCILLVGYVSKQCAIAFGTRPPDTDDPIQTADYDYHHRGTQSRGSRLSRSARAPRKSGEYETGPRSGSTGRRKKGDKGGISWARSIAAPFRDREADLPYRKLNKKDRIRGKGGREGRNKPVSPSQGGTSGDGIELGATAHRTPYESPQGRSLGKGNSRHAGGGGDGVESDEDVHGVDSPNTSSEWGAFEGENNSGHDRQFRGASEPADGDTIRSPFHSPQAPHLL